MAIAEGSNCCYVSRFLIRKGFLITCCSTSSKPDRIQATLKVTDLPDLTTEEVVAIDEAGAKLHKRFHMLHVFGK